MPIHRLTASSPYVSVTLVVGQRTANCTALVDTGASISAIHPNIVADLNPQIIGSVDLAQVGGLTRKIPTYYVQIRLDEQISTGVEVVAAIPSSPCVMLIGHDLMSRWLMAWDGEKDRLVISY